MKKLLLAAFCVLSATAALAAPSTQQLVDSALTAQNKGDSVGAGVPFEVRVNVIPRGPELGLFDENGNLYDTIVFDHGTKIAGKLNRSVVDKTVVLRRTDGYAFSANKDGEVGTTTYDGKFEVLPNNNYDANTNILKLEKLSASTDENNNLVTMDTELNFIKGTRNIKATDTEMRTLIQSVIPAGTEGVGGMYIGTGTFAASLTVNK
ncbi:hypothetical protein [uncultured Fusobacterium sp.]|uniref:hypothetical protein n=1 Tax=uncultured Fusobacterium sp. TaxID=159267 RepID=UPI0025DC642D|nr:hypothetical protein [uncultured Fusobacterium sp.]